MSKTQKDVVYEHLLKRGSISTLECFKKYNITDLQHAIYELRKDGLKITDRWERPKKKIGWSRKYKRYFLERD